jgi:predicted deacetylase
MKAHYIFRIDDVHPNMDLNLLRRLIDSFSQESVVPLLAVIPKNQDQSLYHSTAVEQEFWLLLQNWEKEGKVEIAQHGYSHQLCKTKINSPLYRHVNPFFDEFACCSQDEQNKLILKGKNYLKQKGLNPIAWVSPAHFISSSTIRAIKYAEYTLVSDGLGFMPFKAFGLTFIPQQFEKPRWAPFGIVTFCLHPDKSSIALLPYIRDFIVRNNKSVILFSEAERKKINIIFLIVNFISIPLLRFIRIIRMKNR